MLLLNLLMISPDNFFMKNQLLIVIAHAALLILFGCSTDNPIETVVTTSDFTITIDEKPIEDQLIGTIQGNSNNGEVAFSILSESPEGAFSVDEFSGDLTVADAGPFEFSINPTLTAVVIVQNSNVNAISNVTVTLNEVIPVQIRLDEGETPFDIYQSNNDLLDSLYGKTFQGGLIFYLNTANGTGLVAASSDQSSSIGWNNDNQIIESVNSTSTGIGTGNSNTTAIVEVMKDGSYAAKLCAELNLSGYSDWFLPSLDELNMMYLNLHLKGLGSFNISSPNGHYWSSSEQSHGGAWSQFFRSGGQSNLNTLGKLYVRAQVRFSETLV